MTEMPSYMIQNPVFEPVKPKKRCYYSSSLLYMIFLSIFTYVLIFHVFEVSPFSIFKDTKILFFISNTLILIIAADYGAFTDNKKHDVYGEYISATRNRIENYTYQENAIETVSTNLKEDQEETIVKEIVSDLPPDRILKVVNEIKKPVNTNQTVKLTVANEESDLPTKSYGRSKSDKPRLVRNKIGKKEHRVMKHKRFERIESDNSKCVVVPEKWENVVEESEEYSKMSNEELNKKVEDFIQSFNRQIRLQAIRS